MSRAPRVNPKEPCKRGAKESWHVLPGAAPPKRLARGRSGGAEGAASFFYLFVFFAAGSESEELRVLGFGSRDAGGIGGSGI